MSQVASMQKDLSELREMIAGPDDGLMALIEQEPHLQSPADARRFLEEACVGLESAIEGPLLTTEEVMAELDRRQRLRRSAA